MKIGGTHKGLKSTAVYEGIGIFRLSWEEPRRALPPQPPLTPFSRLTHAFVPPSIIPETM